MISEWAGLELCDIVDGWAARRASNLYGAGVVGLVIGWLRIGPTFDIASESPPMGGPA